MNEKIDESKYLRVTTPLSKYAGYDTVPSNILEYAADRGTRVHMYCTLYAQNILFGNIDDDCFEYVQAFVEWFDVNVDKVIFTEKRLFSDELMIQGQPDLVAILKNKLEPDLIDIKTSLNFSKTWQLQTSAYSHLCRCNDISTENRIVVQLKKDGTFKIHEFSSDTNESDLTLYCAILKAHRFFYDK